MNKELSPKQRADLLAALKARFDANQARHPGLVWAKVRARLEAKPDQLWSLAEMESTGGEPDVVGHDKKSGEFVFMDCAPEMGVALLTEVEYFALQQLGEFDLKTSSWIATPPNIREPGGALYCERRYGRVFVGHNGAQSYYAVRGFRGSLTI